MSGRGEVSDEELDDVMSDMIEHATHHGYRKVLRRFANEMRARGVEHAAEHCPDAWVRKYLTLRAARIREGKQ